MPKAGTKSRAKRKFFRNVSESVQVQQAIQHILGNRDNQLSADQKVETLLNLRVGSRHVTLRTAPECRRKFPHAPADASRNGMPYQVIAHLTDVVRNARMSGIQKYESLFGPKGCFRWLLGPDDRLLGGTHPPNKAQKKTDIILGHLQQAERDTKKKARNTSVDRYLRFRARHTRQSVAQVRRAHKVERMELQRELAMGSANS